MTVELASTATTGAGIGVGAGVGIIAGLIIVVARLSQRLAKLEGAVEEHLRRHTGD